MKKSLLLTVALMAIGLGSCQEDKVPLFQESDLMGMHNDEWTTLTFNGEKVEDPQIIIMDPANPEDKYYKGYSFELNPEHKYVYISDVMAVYGVKDIDFVKFRYPELRDLQDCRFTSLIMPIEITQNLEDISFEGTFSQPDLGSGHVVHHIKGKYAANHITIPALSVEYSRTIENCKLVGKTFELKLDEEGFAVHFYAVDEVDYNGKKAYTSDLCLDYIKLLCKNFKEKTGGDTIRFTFNQDGTVSVAIPQKETGKYVDLDPSKFYIGDYAQLIISQSDKSFDTILNSFVPQHFGFYDDNSLYAYREGNDHIISLRWTLLESFGELRLMPEVYNATSKMISRMFLSVLVPGKASDDPAAYELGSKLMEYIEKGQLAMEPYFNAKQVDK